MPRHIYTLYLFKSEDRTTKLGVRGIIVKHVSPPQTDADLHAFANNGETTYVTKSNADYPYGQSEYRKEHDVGFIKQGNLQHIDVSSIYVYYYRKIDNFIMCIRETERINKEMPHTVEGTTEDSEHTATSPSGDQENSGNYSPRKLSYNALGDGLKIQQTLLRELLDMKRRVFEEDFRRTLESKYLLHYKLRCMLANAIRSYTYHMCHCFTDKNLVHFKKNKSDYELPGKHSVKEYLLHVCGNSTIRRHELRHILQKCFDFDVFHSLTTHPLEMDESFESKMNGLWIYLDAIFPFEPRKLKFPEKVTQEQLPEEEEMRNEMLRLRSFHKVNMNVSYLRLAAAGFYATRNGDETRCFSCGITHRYWEPRDNPFVVHNQRSPTCKHVTGTDEKNVPIQLSTGFAAGHRPPEDRRGHDSTQQTNLSENVSQDRNHTEVLGATGSSRNSPTSSELEAPPSRPTQQSAAREANEIAPVLNFDGSVHPHYSSSETRLASFNVWPEGHSQRPEELVRAGFFYAGYADCVRCFVCGVGLRTWEEGDDPWTEHVRWRSSCAYVEAVRGKRFIMQTLAAIGRSMQATPQTDLNQQTSSNNKINQGKVGEEILTDAACKQALEMGFNREKVKAAAQETVYAEGKSSLTLEVLLETLLVTDGEESEQTEAAQPMASEVPTGTEANIGSRSDDIIQGASRGTDASLSLNSAGDKRRASDPQAQTRQIPHRATEDKDSSSDYTTSSLATHKAEESEDSGTLNRPRQFILTGQRTNNRTNIFYNTDKDSPTPLPGAASSVDTVSSLAGSEGGASATVNRFLSMPTERQRPENIDKIKNKFQHKGKSKEELKATEEETRQLRESSKCKICLEDPANIVFLPCGHLVACAVCSPALERCPVCRGHIRGTIRVHLAEMTREKLIYF